MSDESNLVPEAGIFARARAVLFFRLADPETHRQMSLEEKHEQFPPLESSNEPIG